LAANWPSPGHTVRAANVVVFELIRALAEREDAAVAYMKVSHPGEFPPGDEDKAGLAALAAVGVEILTELALPAPERQGSALMKLLRPAPEHFYPDVVHGSRIAQALAAWNADVLMVPWSEWLTAACSNVPIVKFAYYGNPDHKTGRMRSLHDRKLNGWSVSYLRLQAALSRLEQVHNAIMRRYELLGDVAANDAEYYSANGHPNAFYVRNVWIDRFGEGWRERRQELEPAGPLVIIGNIGKLDGTANRYGLEYLGREILPALRRRLPPGAFRVEILGAGQLEPSIRAPLDYPDVVFRGFVPDIDEAMLSAHVFLCANNATPFKVGHTRYLHAWTLGSCVVAHCDASLSMPEIKHGQNALLGRDAEEIADLIVSAGRDKSLRQRLGDGGWETYQTQFRAESVASNIIERIEGYRSGQSAGSRLDSRPISRAMSVKS
jgi:glycosyltransferase involved in cell wall biosynthesis